MSLRLPTFEDIAAAARRLHGHAVRTPLLTHPSLDAVTGARVLLKPETLQRVGAFKFRGAFNRISEVDRRDFPGGVVACSSGNHAQGVAHAAARLGLPSAIVMPADAPAMKIARTRRFGADVILYDRASEDREAIARSIGKERRAAFIHPFDDAGVIAGQGTAGLELAEDVAAAGIALDAVLVPCSGGGLATGIALAMQRLSPGTGIVIVEPAGFDDFARSLASGHCERNTKATGSIADALMAASPGELTLALARRLVTDAVTVTDAEIASAMRYAFEELKLVVEPGGAAALAALLHARIPCPGRTVAVLLSGANIDATTFASLIAGAAPIPAEHALM